MLDAFSRRLLNRRPKIEYVGPRSTETIPEPAEDTPLPKSKRVESLVKGFENLEKAAEEVEVLIASRAKNEILGLDFTLPEDFAAGQAAARLFPDSAVEIQPGIFVVEEITFDMYNACMQDLKDHGKTVGQQNQLQEVNPDLNKVDFGGLGMDRRPELNNMSLLIPPVPIPAYLLATIPLLFGMLFPLISLYTNSKVIGHTHLPPVGGPGVPVVPA